MRKGTRFNIGESPRRRLSKLKREKILLTAGRLFWEKGYLGTSVENIAKKANVNKATIFYYFEAKSLILFEIGSRVTDEVFAMIEAVASSDLPAKQKVEKIITALIIWEAHHIGLGGMGHIERRNLPPRLQHALVEKRDRIQALFLRVLDEAMRQSADNNMNPKLASFFIWGLVLSIFNWYKADGELSPEYIASQASAFVCRALGFRTADTVLPQADWDKCHEGVCGNKGEALQAFSREPRAKKMASQFCLELKIARLYLHGVHSRVGQKLNLSLARNRLIRDGAGWITDFAEADYLKATYQLDCWHYEEKPRTTLSE